MTLNELKVDLRQVSSSTKAKNSAWFFKTGKGQYGEGDMFVGATVPEQRAIAKKYKGLGFVNIEKLLQSKIHEERLIGLFILVAKYKSADSDKKTFVDFYLENKDRVNSWDLVDSSAPYILGDYLKRADRGVLTKLAKSKSLWDRRIAIVATIALIHDGEFKNTFELCTILENDREDLIHKACGWMLREVGKQDINALENYLEKHMTALPRTTLRYAIERMTQEKKMHFMKKL